MARPPASPPADDPNRDLGFGAVVAAESRQRLLNRDGGFNVRRTGLGWRAALSLYHTLLTLSWPRFLALGGAPLPGGQRPLRGWASSPSVPRPWKAPPACPRPSRFSQAFFFSVQTFSTVGYGQLSPRGLAANLLMTAESYVDLLAVALATGLVFARFSRPHAKILFSEHAVVAPYRGDHRLRVPHRQPAADAARRGDGEGGLHPVPAAVRRGGGGASTTSPSSARGWPSSPSPGPSSTRSTTRARCAACARRTFVAGEAEFLVLLSGVDETFSQTVHARSSYKATEILWNARFADIFEHPEAGEPLSIDVRRIHEVVKA